MAPMSSFVFTDSPTSEIYTLSLHDALPISNGNRAANVASTRNQTHGKLQLAGPGWKRNCDSLSRNCSSFSAQLRVRRSEEHTSELQSRQYLVCRLLLEKKNRRNIRRFLGVT